MRQNDRVRQVRRYKMLLCVAAGVAAGVLITFIAAKGVLSEHEQTLTTQNEALEKENEDLRTQVSKTEAVEDSASLLSSASENWAIALVNEGHPLDTSYVPAEMTEIESERSVDSRIADDLKRMLSDAKDAGLSMYVASAYRSYEKQREVFNNTMQDWISQGYSPLNAYDETKKSVAVPGTSEHATGLAVDIISSEYEALDDRQGDTEEQKWLMEHCWEYGFILRYPSDKSDVTNIVYEPWHYRYVGKEAAKEITEQNITLEEYVLGQ
jgi:D-alanyl-D-alanine carboxypeptidase